MSIEVVINGIVFYWTGCQISGRVIRGIHNLGSQHFQVYANEISEFGRVIDDADYGYPLGVGVRQLPTLPLPRIEGIGGYH
jgi:hypothetical protein